MKTIIFTPVHFKNLYLIDYQYEILSKTIPSFIYHPICNNPNEEERFKQWCNERNLSYTIVHNNPITYEPSLNHTYAMHKGFENIKPLLDANHPNMIYMPIDSDIIPCRKLSNEEIEAIYERGYYGHWKDNAKHIKYLFIGTSMFSQPLIKAIDYNLNFDLTCIGDSGSYNFLPDRGSLRNMVDWTEITSYYAHEKRSMMIDDKEFWFQIHDATWIHLVGGSRQGLGGNPYWLAELGAKKIFDIVLRNLPNSIETLRKESTIK